MAALTEQDREQLQDMVEKDWVSANLARDWDAVMALCSEDLVYMPQDHPVIRGRKEWVKWADAFPKITSFTQRVVDVFGDTLVAAVRGSFKLTMEADGQEVSLDGKFLGTVTKKSGRWLLNATCFNFDGPPSAST